MSQAVLCTGALPDSRESLQCREGPHVLCPLERRLGCVCVCTRACARAHVCQQLFIVMLGSLGGVDTDEGGSRSRKLFLEGVESWLRHWGLAYLFCSRCLSTHCMPGSVHSAGDPRGVGAGVCLSLRRAESGEEDRPSNNQRYT